MKKRQLWPKNDLRDPGEIITWGCILCGLLLIMSMVFILEYAIHPWMCK